jgi:hypothetical protein
VALSEAEELEMLRLKKRRAESGAMPGQIGALARKQALTPTKADAGIVEHAPLVGGIVGGMVGNVPGAAIGAELGTIAKQAADVEAGKTVTTPGLLKEQAINAGSMALGEGAGRYVLSPVMEKILGAGARGVQRLGGLQPRPGAREAQEALQGGGGSLSVGQAVRGTAPELTEKVARLGIFGRPVFEQLDEANQAVLKKARDDLVSSYSTVAPEAIAKRSGTLFQTAMTKGEDAFQSAAKGWYTNLDAHVDQFAKKQIEVQRTIPGRTGMLVDEKGAPLLNVPPQTVSKTITTDKVVDTTSIRNLAKTELQKYDAINKAPPSVLTEMAGLPQTISFGDAQFARSAALKRIRDLRTGSSKDTASLAYLSQYQGQLTGAMDASAQRLPGNLYAEYRRISDAYRRGSTAFGNDVIVDMISKRPEDVADYLYQSGNVSEVVQAKATLRQAKQFDPSIDTDRVWKNLQASYLTRLFSTPSARGAEGEVVGRSLTKAAASEKNLRTMNALFSPGEAAQIRSVFDTARIVQAPAKSGHNLELAIPIGQGAAISALAYGAYTDPKHRPEEVAGAAAVLLAPRVFAKLMTNPETVNALLRLPRMSPRDPKLIPLLTKIGVQREVAEIQDELEEEARNRPTPMFSDPNMEQARKTGSPGMQGVRG